MVFNIWPFEEMSSINLVHSYMKLTYSPILEVAPGEISWTCWATLKWCLPAHWMTNWTRSVRNSKQGFHILCSISHCEDIEKSFKFPVCFLSVNHRERNWKKIWLTMFEWIWIILGGKVFERKKKVPFRSKEWWMKGNRKKLAKI